MISRIGAKASGISVPRENGVCLEGQQQRVYRTTIFILGWPRRRSMSGRLSVIEKRVTARLLLVEKA